MSLFLVACAIVLSAVAFVVVTSSLVVMWGPDGERDPLTRGMEDP